MIEYDRNKGHLMPLQKNLKPKMTLFLSRCNYQILHFDDVHFQNNVIVIVIIVLDLLCVKL